MTRAVPVFFDFACPFSFAAHHRDKALAKELGLRFAHMPWQLSPDVPAEGEANEHAEVTRKLAEFSERCGVEPRQRAMAHNTRRALRGVVHARAVGAEDAYVDRMFDAYWGETANVHEEEVLRRVARESGLDEDGFVLAVMDPALDADLEASRGWAKTLGVESTVTYALWDGKEHRAHRGLGSVGEMRGVLARGVQRAA